MLMLPVPAPEPGRTALRAGGEQQRRRRNGKKSFHDNVFLQRQTSILAWRPATPSSRQRAAPIRSACAPDFRSRRIRLFTLS